MKYIILINSIINIGGGQQYCRNKYLELAKRGYKVFVFSSYKGKIYINELRRFSKLMIPELKYQPYCFSKNHINRTLNRIEKLCGGIDEDSIIDSAGISVSEWGELLAQRNKCKNICFYIDEQFYPSKSEFAFLEYKHRRKEIACTSNKAMYNLFNNHKKLAEKECVSFSAYCSNVVDNVVRPDLKYKHKCNYNIGIFGRLDKGYIEKDLLLLREYINNNPSKTYNIVIIGGGTSKCIYDRIRATTRNIKNAYLMMTDYIFPVPRNLLLSLDVCICSSGCANVTSREGVPTLYVNAITGAPVGIYNYSLKPGDDLRYEMGNSSKFEEYMDMILKDKYCYYHKQIINYEDNDDFSKIMRKEIDYQLGLIHINKSKNYFDIKTLTPTGFKGNVYRIIGKTLGIGFLDFAHNEIFHRIMTKFG